MPSALKRPVWSTNYLSPLRPLHGKWLWCHHWSSRKHRPPSGKRVSVLLLDLSSDSALLYVRYGLRRGNRRLGSAPRQNRLCRPDEYSHQKLGMSPIDDQNERYVSKKPVKAIKDRNNSFYPWRVYPRYLER